MFKAGHKFYTPGSKCGQSLDGTEGAAKYHWVPRLTPEDHSLVVTEAPGGGMSLPDEEGVSSGAHLLRPRRSAITPDSTTQYMEGTGDGEMRLLHKEKTVEMWNKCIKAHFTREGNTCAIPEFSILEEVKRGLCWIQSLRCVHCDFKSEKFKLYEEVSSTSRGPKQGKPNLGFQIGLQDCPMGNAKARVLLASTNTPPPCLSALYRASHKAAKKTSALAEEDLRQRRAKVKAINKLRGLPEETPLNIGVDVRYNSTTIAGRSKLGQNASQAIGVAVEGQTSQKQIVGLYLENKLCYQGAWLRNRGFTDVTCPGGHAGCTATTEGVRPFSEYTIGKNLGEQLAAENILVKYVTTDGDGRSAEGIQAAISEIDPLWEVIRQADTAHLGQSLFRHTTKAVFSDTMFPGTTRQEIKEQQKMFALDLKYRCGQIFSKMYNKYKGDITAIGKRMRTVIEVTLDCYEGDCQDCKKSSEVCPGGKNNWRATSHYLQACGFTDLGMTESDREVLRGLLQFYLGSEALKLISKNTNTNKNEGVNRAISSSLPKNVNFAKTATARALSAVTRLNKGAGNMLVESLEGVGCPISKGGNVAKALKQVQKRHTYHRAYSKLKRVKAAKRKRMVVQMYEHMRAKQQRLASSYIKGQLDPAPPCRAPSKKKAATSEHNYCTPPYAEKNDHAYNKI